MNLESAAPQKADRAALAAWTLVAGVYLWLAFAQLPPGGYWSIDNGYKRIQADNLRFTPWLDLSIGYPGREMDPGLEYVPLGKLFAYPRAGRLYLAQPPAVAVLSRPFILLFGDGGERVVPLAAGLGCAWLAGWLMGALGLRPRWLGILLCGLATPLLFYSLNFWEHTLAAALALAAAAAALGRGDDPPDRRAYLASGVLAGLAGSARREMILLAAALGVVLGVWHLRKRAGWGRLLAWGGAGAAVVMVSLAASYLQSGNLVPAELRLSITPQLTPRAYILVHPWDSLAHFLFGPPAGVLGSWMLLAAAGYGIADRLLPERGWRDALQAALLAAVAAGVASQVPGYRQSGVVFGLLSAAPWLVLAFSARAGRAWRLAAAGAGFWALAALGVGLFTPYGPWHVSQEWGTRFALPAFPIGGILAAAGLARVWERSRHGGAARMHLLAALALVGLSVYIQALGVSEIGRVTSLRREEQAAALDLPDAVLMTNLEWLAPDMPQVYAQRELFLSHTVGGFADLVARAHARGESRLVFISNGTLDEGFLARIAPAGTQVRVVEVRPLGEAGLVAVMVEVVGERGVWECGSEAFSACTPTLI